MIYRFFGRFPLRFIIIVPFIIIILTTAGSIGYLGFRNGQRAVNDLAAQLHDESAHRINQQLDSYLETPQLVNSLNLDAIRLKQLDVNDQAAMKDHFLAQMQRFNSIVSLTYAAEGSLYYVSTWRGAYGVDLGVVVLPEETGYIGEGYEVTPQGNTGKQVFSIPDYDPRVRPWYQTAVQAGKQTWTPVFMWTSKDVGIDAVTPLYTDDGRLSGVMDASLTLNGIGDFLRSIRVSEHGETFIVDEKGLLVASSKILEPYERTGENVERLAALKCDDPATRAAAQNLVHRFGDWANIHASQSFRFDVGGKPQFAQVTPYQNNGLRWWMVVIIPESDFMAQINANNRNTLLLIGMSLAASVFLTILLSRWVTRPILQLNRASKALAAGNWSQKVVLNRRDEMGELAQAFNTMADQQQALFASLQASETRFRTIFESSVDAIIVSKVGLYVAANPACLKMFGYEDQEEIVGQSMLDSIAPGERERIQNYIRQRAHGESAPIIYETRGLRRDGSEFDMEASVSSYEKDGEVYTVAILRDITERKRAKDALQRYTERLQILHEIDRAILSAETPHKIAAAALQHIRRLIPVQRVNVWVIDDQSGERILLATNADTMTQGIGERHPFEKEWLSFFYRNEPLVIDDLRTFPQPVPTSLYLLEQGFLSATLIPLMVQDQLIGALSLTADRPRACSEEHIQVAREISDQLAVAIRQARLFEAERDQRTLAEALRDSVSAVSRTLTLNDVLDRVLINVERVVPHDACNIMLIEKNTARVVRERGWTERRLGNWITAVHFDPDEVDRWRLLFSGEHPQPYAIADTHADPNWQMSAESEWIHSTAKAPIYIGGELIGILNLDSAALDFFTQQHLDRLQTFADQAAVAIRNAQLFEAERQRRRIAEILVWAAAILNSTLDLEQVLDLILFQLNDVIDFDSVSIQQKVEDGLIITACQGFEHPDRILGFKISLDPQRPNWQVMTEKKPFLVPDVTQAYPNFQIADPTADKGTRTWLGLPLLARQQVIGLIALDRTQMRPFTSDEIDLAMAFANQASTAIENAHLYAQVQRHAAELEQRVVERTAELEVANEELRVLSRMKDQFVSNVSHELRTPITSMMLQLHLASKTAPPTQQERLEIWRRETRRLEDLIESLLFLSRLDQDRVTITFVETDLTKLVSDLVQDRQPLSQQHGLRLSFIPLPDCPPVTSDPRLIGQVLSILLTNAINYTPNGGQIEVEIICGEGGAGFQVSDTGLGIPEDERGQLFSRFFRGKVGRDSGKSGTGLGLSIAKEIIDRHHGHIEIESEGIPGRGTTFKVWLPVERENH